MRWVGYVLGCCLVLAPVPASSDACSDLQAAIAKAAALKQEMMREASPFVSSSQMPARNEGVCKAAETLRTHLVMLAAQMRTSQCLNEDQYRSQAAIVDSSMREANSNVGLFCN
jgi:cytochrome c-type biogenesis protein CcmH/NrfF